MAVPCATAPVLSSATATRDQVAELLSGDRAGIGDDYPIGIDGQPLNHIVEIPACEILIGFGSGGA